ncbi:alpha-mannosidase 2C1-like protein [Gaertneriomyces semiglobifer]|nr:alpha-mannosidase 2C1-like protein [Gaertneriomyces semiglobifer]
MTSSYVCTPLNGMQKHRSITIERLQKFIQQGQFEDVNLRSALVSERSEGAVSLSVYSVPDGKRIPFAEAIKGDYQPARVGQSFGPTWSTHWFKVTIGIPSSFAGKEVQLIFDPSCEGLVWSTDGQPLMGITGGGNGDRHVEYLLTKKAKDDEHFELYIEIACNGMFGAGAGGNGSINPPVMNRQYRLETAELVVPSKEAYHLLWDFEILLGIVKEVGEGTQLSWDALRTADQIVNTFRNDTPATIAEARRISTEFFKKRTDFGYQQHVMTAVGNCHIDTAWLWPFDETKRKAARSFATQCGLIEAYPDYTFVASQAQQFAWVEQLYPTLFERIKRHAKTGQFIPIGGTWVEMDCNIPSGEALCRQFLYGQRYFESRFGERCLVFWLPDTFGYSAQLPQIVHEAGLKYFFTQKLSWNNINKFPHTTFMWTGLDGTSVLTHFSPCDTYTAQATVRDVAFGVSNNKDKAYSNQSLLLYGNGDGGGGPLIPMIERLKRMQSLSGLPASVQFGHPNKFYETLEATSKDLVHWKGELYFELHRGTYTSQAQVKRGNRSSELLLRVVEILSSLCVARSTTFQYPKDELDRLWKLTLLRCSSIGMVYIDALKFYEDIAESGTKLATAAFQELLKLENRLNKAADAVTVFNPTSWKRENCVVEVALTEAGVTSDSFVQLASDRRHGLVLIDEIAAYATSTVRKRHHLSDIVNKMEGSNCVSVHNEFLDIYFDESGRIASIFDKRIEREVIAKPYSGNVFKIFEDIPIFWDAWDVEVYHLEKGWDASLGKLTVEESGPLRVVLKAEHPITDKSKIIQTIIVHARSPMIEFDTFVDWHENRKFLKVEFPLNIANDFATYETQIGFVRRPTHYNNSWDLARFEVCGHKFVDYSEHGYGVALLNDCKYGFAVHDNIVRMSLLRSPKAPDQDCDMGEHIFRYALLPHVGSFSESNVAQAGYEFNVPLLVSPLSGKGGDGCQYFELDCPNVVLDTIKLAEDCKDERVIVLRLYEAQGGRGTAQLKSALKIKKAVYANILEDAKSEVLINADGALILPYTPFKLLTIMLTLE